MMGKLYFNIMLDIVKCIASCDIDIVIAAVAVV